MYSFLLKKALPFTLTFIFGAALSALVALFWSDRTSYEVMQVRQFRLEEYGRGRRECRMRRHDLVAESKPLNILDVPSAFWASGQGAGAPTPVRMLVTFGSDGTVQGVEQLDHFELPQAITKEAKSAAWRIKFEPEKVDSVPVTVRREVEINFWFE